MHVLRRKGAPSRRTTRRRHSPSVAVAAIASVAALVASCGTGGAAPKFPAGAGAPHQRTVAQAWAMLETAEAHLTSAPVRHASTPNTLCPSTPSVPAVPFTPVLTCFPGSPGLSAPNPVLCPEPKPPAATWPAHPAGAGYGIPFVASVNNIVILTSYNAYLAQNPSAIQNSTDTNFNEPWGTVVYNITGWVTGLLQLPSLQAADTQITFCPPGYGPGANQCPSHVASTGCTWFVQFTTGSWRGAGFDGDCTKTGRTLHGVVGGCLPYVVTLAADTAHPPQLTVLGLNSADQLEVSATASANETLTSFAQGLAVTCKGSQPAALSLSTEPPPPGFVPPTGPPAPPKGTFQGVAIPDDRPLQLPPSAVSGPLASISASASSNDFSIPAFLPADQDPHQDPTCGAFWYLLDIVAAGLNPNQVSYYPACDIFSPTHAPCNVYLDPRGFSQATGETNVVYIGIPRTPPPGFSF